MALTLRHDRLDNFWFTLMHELAHIALHFDGEHTVFLDDLESDGEPDIFETEADTLATHALIDNDIWESKRPTTKETIIGLSRELSIHSAIIAGRIRYEENNYHRYSNLIGRGLVRKLFD